MPLSAIFMQCLPTPFQCLLNVSSLLELWCSSCQVAASENERLHKMAANEEGRAAPKHGSSKVKQAMLQMLMK
ncbi:hypothetical protein SLEP1_g43100 [Rubroshorea leprosula]|uniref:Uncharacterized protein n=1 Tax=Rubroshorea leprosula TaxID=152421 RepID=A0AAV5LCH3_9ROSI|nr:hypothetical protein SLEP1_g43100 [Rubroshorea leprosula]